MSFLIKDDIGEVLPTTGSVVDRVTGSPFPPWWQGLTWLPIPGSQESGAGCVLFQILLSVPPGQQSFLIISEAGPETYENALKLFSEK